MHLLLRLTVMLLPTLAGLQIATQRVAAAYGYHAALGRPIIGHLYAPWRVGIWVWHFGQQQPDVFRVPLLIAGAGGVVGILGVGLTLLWTTRQSAPTSYGSAVWARDTDVKRSGLV